MTFSDHCEYKTHAKNDLKQHLLRHLIDDPRVIHRCQFEGCDKVFRARPSLLIHQRIIHLQIGQLTKYSCHICSKTFNMNRKVKEHIKFVHEKYRPYACDIPGCGGSFSSTSHLRRHKKSIHKIFNDPPLQRARN